MPLIAWAAPLVAIGALAHHFPLQRVPILGAGVALAADRVRQGAYDDSGGEIPFSVLLVLLVATPAAVGALAAAVVAAHLRRWTTSRTAARRAEHSIQISCPGSAPARTAGRQSTSRFESDRQDR